MHIETSVTGALEAMNRFRLRHMVVLDADGRVVRVPVPELSEERRKEMVKVASRMAEEARVSARNVRRDANESCKALQKSSAISEDEGKLTLDKIQKITDKATVGLAVNNIFNKLHPEDDTFNSYPYFWRAFSPIGRELLVNFNYKFN